MTRALDHIVWPTRDLEALAECFRRLGFTVGRRNRHPWGTENHIIQFDGVFVELLGFAPDYVSAAAEDQAFPFAGFCEQALSEGGPGAAMLVLRSGDAAADAARLQRDGLGQGAMLPFSRAAQGPDGSDRTVAFTIAFATIPGLADLGTFVCQQRRPENFWNPAAQQHDNGATGITGLTVRSAEPKASAAGLAWFAESKADVAGVLLADGCRLALVSSEGTGKPAISAIAFRVKDLERLAALVGTSGCEGNGQDGTFRVTAPEFGRTALVFRQD